MGAADVTARPLHGRDGELAELVAVRDGARRGHSGALLMSGSAGIGKSALLDQVVAGGHGCRVLRIAGVQAEAGLAYAGLERLLGSALALPVDSTEQVGHEVLRVLAAIGADQPVLVCVDDLHLIDEPSARALEFAARRLDHATTHVAFVGAVRPAVSGAATGISARELRGLGVAECAAVLAEHSPVAPAVAAALAAGTGGNPLALIELAALLAPTQLAGRESLPDPLPIGARSAAGYGFPSGEVAAATALLLVIAAADELGDPALLCRAAQAADLPVEVLDDAEATGLITIDAAGVRFRHPLDRSAVYHQASGRVRRAAHAAIAAALARPDEVDRRAWHEAATARGHSEELADALEDAAARARGRGGYPAGARLLERAALLTSDGPQRSRRFVAAAADTRLAGRTAHAGWLLDQAAQAHPDECTRASIVLLRAEIELRAGSVTDAYRALLAAADRLAHRSPASALAALVSAGEAAGWAGNPGWLGEACLRANRLELRGDDPHETVLLDLLRGTTEILGGNAAAGTPHLRRALAAGEHSGDAVMLTRLAAAATLVGDEGVAHTSAHRALDVARTTGALAAVPQAMDHLIEADLFHGAFESAQARALDAIRIADETGQLNAGYHLRANLALIAAFLGDEPTCGTHATAALRGSRANRLGLAAATANWALGLVDLGMCRNAAAAQRLSGITSAGPGAGHPKIVILSMPHLVEALVRLDPPDLVTARAAAARFDRWSARADQPWSSALSARCAALVAEEADEHYQRALWLHGLSGRPFDRARTQLLYGELLRRNRNRAQAKVHLRGAWETFDRLGAGLWEQRARGELRACGETVAAREGECSTSAGLTAQELRVARLVAAGATNREVAAQLYVSPRTVDYHLRKVFNQLGISSRVELAHLDELR